MVSVRCERQIERIWQARGLQDRKRGRPRTTGNDAITLALKEPLAFMEPSGQDGVDKVHLQLKAM